MTIAAALEPWDRHTTSMRNVGVRRIPKDPLLEIDHTIRRKGALSCGNCRGPEGVMDWKGLGYPADQIENLTQKMN